MTVPSDGHHDLPCRRLDLVPMIAVTPDPTFSNVTESVRRTSSRGQLWVEGGDVVFRRCVLHGHRLARIFAAGVTSTEISLEGIQVAHRYRPEGAVTYSPLRHLAVATSVLALLICAVAVLLADPGQSGASVIAVSGPVLFESPPPIVSYGTGESNTTLNFFTERTNFALPTTTPIDITPGPSFPTTYTGTGDLTPGTLAAGTAVDTYFMYSNPVGQPETLYHYIATFTFSAPILGLVVTSSTLSATNVSLGAAGTSYDIPGTGLENDGDGDAIELVGASTIHVEFATSVGIDAIRVITAATPGTGPGGTPGTGPDGTPGTGPGGTGGGGVVGYTELCRTAVSSTLARRSSGRWVDSRSTDRWSAGCTSAGSQGIGPWRPTAVSSHSVVPGSTDPREANH